MLDLFKKKVNTLKHYGQHDVQQCIDCAIFNLYYDPNLKPAICSKMSCEHAMSQFHKMEVAGANFYRCKRCGQHWARSYRVTKETLKQDCGGLLWSL